MLTLAILAALTLQQADTTVPVDKGIRLRLSTHSGEITVKAWDRAAVRVQADIPESRRLEVETSGPTLGIRVTGRGGPTSADFILTVPTWMSLSLNSIDGDITITGTRGEVEAQSVRGNVTVTGGSSFVSLSSVEGDVSLRDAKGRIELNAVNAGIELNNVSGDIKAESVNGDVVLTAIESASVEAGTVNGEITYEGSIRNDGRYSFRSHNGDLTIAVPEATSAAVTVSTFNGDFESDFPVTLSPGSRQGKRFSFTIGGGSAKLDLDSFGGTIALKRPGSMPKKH